MSEYEEPCKPAEPFHGLSQGSRIGQKNPGQPEESQAMRASAAYMLRDRAERLERQAAGLRELARFAEVMGGSAEEALWDLAVRS